MIRREDLKKAEQMERVRAVCEARIQEELQEEAGRKRRHLDRKLRENYATELALLRPPPPPPPAAAPLRETAVEDPTPTSSWVPLLPNEQFQEDSASHLAGYGPQRQKRTQCSTFTGSVIQYFDFMEILEIFHEERIGCKYEFTMQVGARVSGIPKILL